MCQGACLGPASSRGAAGACSGLRPGVLPGRRASAPRHLAGSRSSRCCPSGFKGRECSPESRREPVRSEICSRTVVWACGFLLRHLAWFSSSPPTVALLACGPVTAVGAPDTAPPRAIRRGCGVPWGPILLVQPSAEGGRRGFLLSSPAPSAPRLLQFLTGQMSPPRCFKPRRTAGTRQRAAGLPVWPRLGVFASEPGQPLPGWPPPSTHPSQEPGAAGRGPQSPGASRGVPAARNTARGRVGVGVLASGEGSGASYGAVAAAFARRCTDSPRVESKIERLDRLPPSDLFCIS